MALKQHGVFNRRQALAAGFDTSGISRRVASGKWRRSLPEVFAVAGAPDTWHRRLMEACLWGGENAATSHCSAAALWGLDGFRREPLELSLTDRRRAPRPEITVHHVDQHLISEICHVDSIPTTSPRRTLLDLAGTRHRRFESALDQSIRQQLTTLGQLWLLFEEEWTRGRRGIAIMRSALWQRTPGKAPTDSDLETDMLRLVTRYQLPKPETQYRIRLPSRVVRVDFAYPECRLVIETDSYAFHSDREAFEADRERDNELQELGWRILRFTWAMIRFQPARVAQQLRAALSLPSS